MKNAIPPMITSILIFIFSLIWAVFLILAMNGFSETEGTRVLITYGVWTILTIILFSAGSRFGVRFISSKMESVKPWIITLLVVIACSILGSVGVAFGSFIMLMVTGA